MAECKDCGAIEESKHGWRGRRCRECVAAAERHRYHSKTLQPAVVPLIKIDKEQETPPEHYYKDDGCSISPKCLSCPLPVCRYDGKEGRIAYQNYVKNLKPKNRDVVATM